MGKMASKRTEEVGEQKRVGVGWGEEVDAGGCPRVVFYVFLNYI